MQATELSPPSLQNLGIILKDKLNQDPNFLAILKYENFHMQHLVSVSTISQMFRQKLKTQIKLPFSFCFYTQNKKAGLIVQQESCTSGEEQAKLSSSSLTPTQQTFILSPDQVILSKNTNPLRSYSKF